MKLIITEDMLKSLVRDALTESDDYTGTFKQTVSLPKFNGNFNFSMPSGNQGMWNGNIQAANIGNWDVGKTLTYLFSHSGNRPNGRCAENVENAIAAGGLPRMHCGENGGDNWADSLHYTGVLKKYGFDVTDSGILQGNGNYGGQLSPGDIIILDAGRRQDGRKRVHIAMWAGNQWISDFKQQNANVYSVPGRFWIYRFKPQQKQQ